MTPWLTRTGAAALLCLALLGSGCSITDAPQSAGGALPADISVMSFNIEWGGKHVSFDNVVEAIRRADADIAGIQEAEGNLGELASALGWHYDRRSAVISRFPLIAPAGADGHYIYAEIEPGRVVAVVNVHLPSDPYGPYAVRDGAAVADVLQLERNTRLPDIRKTLAELGPLLRPDLPVFLTGDFNPPSHEDWTGPATGARPYLYYSVAWPVTELVAAAGFRDSWRRVHPDPVARPGLTWWAGRPPLAEYAPGPRDPQDRIDYVWYAGPATPHSSALVGEPEGPGVTVSVSPWPSDHRAVVSRFTVKPAPLPRFVAAEHHVYREGDAVKLRYNAGDGQAGHLSVHRESGAGPAIVEQAVTGTGRLRLGAQTIVPGRYNVVLKTPTTGDEMTGRFQVLERNATPGVGVATGTYAVNEPIDVSWTNAPGNRNDYIAVFGAGNEQFTWRYIGAEPEGRLLIGNSTLHSGWPLAPGTYTVRLLEDDGYTVLAKSDPFIVE
ncbi:MAG: endonuclease/exonuclease/phosphatase family protein [Woeseiaceae bacterium]|nr:endonuclease/exonuclease/phosphatase family protein [Woeseiaceae bacterium]